MILNILVFFPGDAAEFLNFLLNTLHIALNGTRKTSSSIIYKIFRGRLHEYTRKVIPVETTEEARRTLLDTEEYKGMGVVGKYFITFHELIHETVLMNCGSLMFVCLPHTFALL